MKICFFLDNINKQNGDLREPSKNGNNGMPGSEYMLWTIPYYLKRFYKELEIIMQGPYISNFSEISKNIEWKDIYQEVEINAYLNFKSLSGVNRCRKFH